MDEIERLRGEAEAEDFARSMGMKPNPWAGASERLRKFEEQCAIEKAIAEREAASIATSARYAAFRQAISAHTSLAGQISAANDRARIILETMQSPAMREASETLDGLKHWRLVEMIAGEAEMIYRSCGVFPEHHFLHGVRPELLEKMRELDALRKEHDYELRTAANARDQIVFIEREFPALRGLQEVAAPV